MTPHALQQPSSTSTYKTYPSPANTSSNQLAEASSPGRSGIINTFTKLRERSLGCDQQVLDQLAERIKPSVLNLMIETGGALDRTHLNKIEAVVTESVGDSDYNPFIRKKIKTTNKELTTLITHSKRNHRPVEIPAEYSEAKHPILALTNGSKKSCIRFYDLPATLDRADIGSLSEQGIRVKTTISKPSIELGKGSYGTVRYARRRIAEQTHDAWTAMKTTRNFNAQNIRREIEIARKINTVNQQSGVHVGLALVDSSEVYLADIQFEANLLFELAQPSPIEQHIPRSAQAARQFFVCLANKLAILHEYNISHQDIKASNLLVDTNGEPVFTDFGISTTSNTSNENSGASLYISPEKWNDQPFAPKPGDVYALALTIGKLLGKDEFTNLQIETPRNVSKLTALRQIREQAFQALSGPPENLSQLLIKALDPDPTTRMTAKQFAKALATIEWR